MCLACGGQMCPGVDLSFANTNLILINDNMAPPTVSAPYPSSISVTGVSGSVVTRMTVTLLGFSHAFPSDVAVLLVGPLGQEAVLMANAGGQDKFSVTNLTLTFDDQAVGKLPINAALVSGVYQPTNGYLAYGFTGLPFDFPPPAPPGTADAPAALSVFSHADPSGLWRLFLLDDVAGDSGVISRGWSLQLSVGLQLRVATVNTNIVISWPVTFPGARLQTSGQAGSGWVDASPPPVLIDGLYKVTNSISGPSTYYQLVGE
jgi:hypothetical protein